LRDAPTIYKVPNPNPFRLYNRIVPPEMVERGDRSFAFVGAVGAVGTAMYVPGERDEGGLTNVDVPKQRRSGLQRGSLETST